MKKKEMRSFDPEKVDLKFGDGLDQLQAVEYQQKQVKYNNKIKPDSFIFVFEKEQQQQNYEEENINYPVKEEELKDWKIQPRNFQAQETFMQKDKSLHEILKFQQNLLKEKRTIFQNTLPLDAIAEENESYERIAEMKLTKMRILATFSEAGLEIRNTIGNAIEMRNNPHQFTGTIFNRVRGMNLLNKNLTYERGILMMSTISYQICIFSFYKRCCQQKFTQSHILKHLKEIINKSSDLMIKRIDKRIYDVLNIFEANGCFLKAEQLVNCKNVNYTRRCQYEMRDQIFESNHYMTCLQLRMLNSAESEEYNKFKVLIESNLKIIQGFHQLVLQQNQIQSQQEEDNLILREENLNILELLEIVSYGYCRNIGKIISPIREQVRLPYFTIQCKNIVNAESFSRIKKKFKTSSKKIKREKYVMNIRDAIDIEQTQNGEYIFEIRQKKTDESSEEEHNNTKRKKKKNRKIQLPTQNLITYLENRNGCRQRGRKPNSLKTAIYNDEEFSEYNKINNSICEFFHKKGMVEKNIENMQQNFKQISGFQTQQIQIKQIKCELFQLLKKYQLNNEDKKQKYYEIKNDPITNKITIHKNSEQDMKKRNSTQNSTINSMTEVKMEVNSPEINEFECSILPRRRGRKKTKAFFEFENEQNRNRKTLLNLEDSVDIFEED